MFQSSMFRCDMFHRTSARAFASAPVHTRTTRPLLRRDGLSLALAAALTAAWAMPAFAQDSAPGDADELDRIIVTAQKREQQIEDVPISINAYSGEFLQAQGINDYGDLGTLVPGLEVQTQSVSNPSISSPTLGSVLVTPPA